MEPHPWSIQKYSSQNIIDVINWAVRNGSEQEIRHALLLILQAKRKTHS
jgi:hypothetical protein